MHVHVYARGVDGQIEEIRGGAVLGNQFFVGFQNRARQVGALEEAAVDEQILFRVAPFGRRRTADETLRTGYRRVGFDLQQVLFDVAPHHVDDAPGQRRRGQRVDRSVVRVELETYVRVAQRHALEFGPYLRRRGRAFVQETAAGRHVVEQIADIELRPHGTHHRGLRDELPAVDFGARAHVVALLPRAQLHLRHRRYRRQRFAAEAEGRQGIDVLDRRYLARRVTVEGHPCVDGRHAAAVVDNLYQVAPAVAEVDLHARRPGVDGVLHHLLDHRCGAVHHLARRNLVGDDFG